MNTQHYQQILKKINVKQKGYSIHDLSLYEITQYAQTSVDLITNIYDKSYLVNKYKTNNPIKLSLLTMINNEFGAHCQRKILKDVNEVFPIKVSQDNINVKNINSMIGYQIDDF